MCNLTIYWKIFYRKSENVYLKFDRDSAILSCDNDDLKSRYKSFLQFIVFYLLQWIRTGKKRKRLRKKSHILVARYLADQMPATKSLQSHRKAFCLGSILPDIKPSFLTKKHEYFGTFEEIQGKMKALIDNDPKESKERVYWRRFGEVMHYMADYFTFPHNTNFTGNLYEHNKYEKHLKNHLKRYIESGAADRMVISEASGNWWSILEMPMKDIFLRSVILQRMFSIFSESVHRLFMESCSWLRSSLAERIF